MDARTPLTSCQRAFIPFANSETARLTLTLVFGDKNDSSWLIRACRCLDERFPGKQSGHLTRSLQCPMKVVTPDGNCCNRLYPEEMFPEGGASFCGPSVARRAPHLLETSVPGVFAASDIRASNIKRVASAVS